jgi:hypothetical protein
MFRFKFCLNSKFVQIQVLCEIQKLFISNFFQIRHLFNSCSNFDQILITFQNLFEKEDDVTRLISIYRSVA